MKKLVKCALTLVMAVCGYQAVAKSYTRDFASDSLAKADGYSGGSVSGKKLTTGDGSDLVYVAGGSNDSLNRNAYGWYAGATITWPGDEEINAGKAKHVLSFPAQTVYANAFAAGSGLTYDNTYMKHTYWWTWITPEQAYAAKSAGEDKITRTITINGEETNWVVNKYKVNASTFTVEFPLKDAGGNDIVLKANGIKWYPAVALIGEKVYGDLNVAIKTWDTVNCVATGEVTEAIEVAENSTLVLNKGSYTITGLGNLTLKGGTFDFEPKAAGCNVPTGYEVQDNGDNTWTVVRSHIHAWEFVLNGATLTANCTNTTSECDVETTSITLTVTGGSDGVAPTFAIDNQEEFLKTVNMFNPSLVTIGEIKTVRTTDDGAATDKWYVGNYESTCDVTIEGEGVKTLVKEFSIAKPEGGYTKNGWVVGSSDIRYNDNDSETAIAAAEDGDTIYYRGNDREFATHEFSVGDKDLTIDFGGKTLTYTGGPQSMTLKNTGSGTLTFQNVVIKQPQYTFAGIKTSYHINVEGNIAFGSGVVVQTTASSSDNQCKITSTSGKLSVLDGGYQCKFLADGGAVEISGGAYTYNDHCKPSADMLKDSYIVRVVSTEQLTVYQVVYHEHHAAYAAEGNVISATCDAQDHEYCGYGTTTATLNAPDKTDDGQPYDLATIDYSDGFPEQTGVITYFSGTTEIPAPSTFGSYTAKTTIGGATAAKDFKVIHVHHFEYDADQTAGTITARCTTTADCDFNVNKRIATLTAQNGTYTGAGQDLAATSTNTGDFPTNVVMTYSCEGKPTNVGDYTATMTVTNVDSTTTSVTKDFSIAKAAMGNVTATMTSPTLEYTCAEQQNTLKSATLGSYGLTADDYDLSGVLSATGSGYSNETYTVTLTGKGNFEGTQTVEWTITAPTVPFAENPLTAAIIEGGTTAYATCEGKTLTVTDSTLLPYQNGWYAGFVIAYPNTVDTWASNSQVTDPANLRFRNSTMDEGVYYTGTQIDAGESALTAISKDSHSWWAAAGDVTYVKNLTWWAPVITPALVEQAAAEEKTELTYTATLGGLKWTAKGNTSSTTFEGVRFADFTIKVPLAGFVFALPSGSYDIGGTVLSAAKIRLGAGASVTTTAQQAEGQIYTEVTGYQVYETEEGGVYTYSCDVATHYVTVPDVAHATKVVSVDGTKIVGVDNVYAVHYGDTVTIVYTPDAGYETADGTKTIEGVTGDTTLTDLPTIVAVFTVKAPENASVTKVATNGVELVEPYKVVPGTAVTVTYTADEGYLFANGTNKMDAEITVNEAGEQAAPAGTETKEGEAKIGTTYYLTLADALTNAADKAIITVVKDCEVAERINLDPTKDITLDANGKTITIAEGIYAFVYGGATDTTGEGTLTITGDGTFYAPTADSTCFLWARRGNIVVENGSFSMDGDSQCVYADNGCKATINGGTFVNRTGVDVLNVNNTRSVVTDIQCYGGSYSKDPATGDDSLKGSFVAEGYASYKDGEMFTVAKLPAVTVTDITPPADLEAAFAYTTTDTTSVFTNGWKVDFFVSFDADVAAGAVSLKGQYGATPWMGGALPVALAADEEYQLCKTGLQNEVSVEQLLQIGTFNCGVTNIFAKGGTTMKVVLKMYKGGESFVLNTTTYELVGKGPQTAEVGGGAVLPTEDEGVYEVSPDPTTGNVNVIPETVSETDVFVVTITNDMTITGVPADQIEVKINGVEEPIPNSVFVGGDEKGFSTALNPDGSAKVGEETIPVTPVLTESTDEVKPFVIDETNVSVGVKTIPGLNYSLLSGDTATEIKTVVKTVLATEARMVLEAAKTADPAKFYKIQVEK